MYTHRTLDGTQEDLLDPAFRSIDFSDEPAIVVVSTQLRYAWTAQPDDEDASETALTDFIGDNHRRSDEERKSVPQNPDKSIHTPWRENIHKFWHHVFYDIMSFLPSVNCSVGHYHPPEHQVFGVDYPVLDDKGEVQPVKKKWDTNVILLPAFLEQGVSVRMARMLPEDNEMFESELGKFDGSNPFDIWYIKGGTEVNVYIEGDLEQNKDREGIAAVFVYAKLCKDPHGGETICCDPSTDHDVEERQRPEDDTA